MILNKLAEDSILGSLIYNPQLLEKYDLQPELFGYFLNRAVYGTCLALRENRADVNLSALNDKLTKNDDYVVAGGLEYLKKLIQSADEREFDNNLTILKEKAYYRKKQEHHSEINGIIFDNPVDIKSKISEKQSELEKLEKSYILDTNKNLQLIGEVATEFIQDVDLRRTTKGLIGMPTGIRQLDSLTLGLHKGDLNLIAARSSIGKTALKTSITANNIKLNPNNGILVFTLEMTKKQYTGRVISNLAMVDGQRYRDGSLSMEEWFRAAWAWKTVQSANIKIDETVAINPSYIDDTLRYLDRNDDLPKLVIVDYLQIMTGNGKHYSREQEVGSITRDLKNLAKRYKIPFLVGAQINRKPEENSSNKRPTMSHIRESGSAEQDSDLVLLLYRDKYYSPNSDFGDVAEIIIGKQRNGPVGTVYSAYLAEYTKFADLQLK
jgi:replicative DNA helicase